MIGLVAVDVFHEGQVAVENPQGFQRHHVNREECICHSFCSLFLLR